MSAGMFWFLVNMAGAAIGVAAGYHPAVVALSAFVAGMWFATLILERRGRA